jgi:hypothetical protein
MFRGQFRGLRAAEHPELVTGVLWIRDCEITNHGTQSVFRLIGDGWQWIDQTKKQAKGKFQVRQYVRFGVHVTMPGAFDIGYDRDRHIVSLWFTPATTPQIDFTPREDFDVDRKGAWSEVVGALATAFSSSPEERAEVDAKKQGTQQFETTLADGLAMTIDLCTGLGRFNLGRRPKGTMQPPDVGETKRVPVELHPGGLVISGPQLAPRGMTVYAEATQGAARLVATCEAENAALAFVDGHESATRELASVDVRGKATLRVPPTKCPVAIIARSLDDAPATLAWLRPPSEIARSTGGPIMKGQSCGNHSASAR